MENQYDIIIDTTFMVGVVCVKFLQCFRIKIYFVTYPKKKSILSILAI